MPAADLAWLLAAFGLVSLMFPGLALFYGGMLNGKNVLNMSMMVMSTLGVTAVLYALYGHGMVSGNSLGGLGLLGDPTEHFGLLDVSDAGTGGAETVYNVAFYVLFAAITIAIVASGAAGRVKFGAWLVFAAIWLTLVYFPLGHWVFTASDEETGLVGGWMRNVLELHDYAGGTAVHMNSGVAALALALVLGKRRQQAPRPHNMPLVVLGAGVLWFGWFGFNGGCALGANYLAQYVVLATLFAGSTGMLGFCLVEKLRDGHCTTLGMASGIISGLVAITPAADALHPLGALAVGFAAGAVVAWACTWKSKLGIDDSLDAFAVHGVGGVVGTVGIMLIGAPGAPGEVTGVLFGGSWDIVWRELTAIAVTMVFSFVMTYAIAWCLDRTIGLRIEPEREDSGLDVALHAETAYDIDHHTAAGPRGQNPATAPSGTPMPAPQP